MKANQDLLIKKIVIKLELEFFLNWLYLEKNCMQIYQGKTEEEKKTDIVILNAIDTGDLNLRSSWRENF